MNIRHHASKIFDTFETLDSGQSLSGLDDLFDWGPEPSLPDPWRKDIASFSDTAPHRPAGEVDIRAGTADSLVLGQSVSAVALSSAASASSNAPSPSASAHGRPHHALADSSSLETEGVQQSSVLAAAAAETPTTDTIPGDWSSTEVAFPGAYGNHWINSPGDEDWFKITLNEGDQITITVDAWGKGAIADPEVKLYYNISPLSVLASQILDVDLIRMVEDDNSGPFNGALLTYTAQNLLFGNTFYIAVSGASTDQTGQYMITVNAGDERYRPHVPMQAVAEYITDTFEIVNGNAPRYWSDTNLTYSLDRLNDQEKHWARLAFEAWSDVANLSFTEIESHALADIRFKPEYDLDSATTYTYPPSGGELVYANVRIGRDFSDDDARMQQTYVHEIGHALGLGHSGPYNGGGTLDDVIYENDSRQMSVMSYVTQELAGVGSNVLPFTPQMADIVAIQDLYGAGTAREGDTVYGFHATDDPNRLTDDRIYDFQYFKDNGKEAPAFTLYDSGGYDTLDASGYDMNQVIDLTPGYYSSIGGYTNNIGIYGGYYDGSWIEDSAVIEEAIGGSGDDIIWAHFEDDGLPGGNRNTLKGGAGIDTLMGGAGQDELWGGTYNDHLWGDSPNTPLDTTGDTFVFEDNWGTDTVYDFDDGSDTLDMTQVSGLSSFGQLSIYEGSDGLTHIEYATGNWTGWTGQIILGNYAGTDVVTQDDFTFAVA